MIRIVASVSLMDLLIARGIAANVREKIMRHGEVSRTGNYFDILVDRDPQDLPDSVVNFLRNRPEIVYVAEWNMLESDPGTVLKGTDPGIHIFAGWPV